MSLMLNDLGIDPNEWFDNPLDKMPIATDEPIEYDNKYAPPEKLAELESMAKESNPRPEEDIAGWFKDETEPLDIPIQETLHQKMYEIATAKYNPFSIGGSQRLGGGSEEAHK